MKLTSSLNRLQTFGSGNGDSRRMLLKYLGENFNPDTEINLLTILESNGTRDTIWALRATVQDSRRISALLTIEFAEQSLADTEERCPFDSRPRKTIQAARDCLEGVISIEELRASKSDLGSSYKIAWKDPVGYAKDPARYAAAAVIAAVVKNSKVDNSASLYALYSSEHALDAALCGNGISAFENVKKHQAEIIRSILEP